MPSSVPGLLVVGHGTRSKRGREAFLSLVDHVSKFLPGTLVRSCFLEAADPDIETALGQMASQGCPSAVVVPLLLFSAGHAKRDIPDAAGRASQTHQIPVTVTPVLGTHPRILGLSARRFRETLRLAHADPRQVLLLMVGRGSGDPEAIDHMRRFVRQRVARTPVGRVVTAFLAMADPKIEAVVPEIAQSSYPTVIVQPHLLFPGHLMCKLRRTVKVQDRHDGRQQWLLTEALGDDHAVALAVVDRFQQTLAEQTIGREPPDAEPPGPQRSSGPPHLDPAT